jgi:WD40 repeat protein
MNRNVPSPAPSAPTAAPSRRRTWLLALLVLLLVGGGIGGTLWWRSRSGAGTGGSGDPTKPPPGAARDESDCSDDEDPKYLPERIQYGPPLTPPSFDRKFLDSLAERPIPEVEKYPWLPENLVAILGEHRMRGYLFALHPEGKLIAVAGGPWIRIGPLETLHEKWVFFNPVGAGAMAWSPKGDKLAVVGGDATVRLHDLSNLDKPGPILALERSNTTITSLSFSGDGRYLLGGDNAPRGGVAWVWNLEDKGKIVQRLRHIGPVQSVAFSPVPGDNRALTGGGPEDGQLHLWDAVAGKQTAAIDFRKLTDEVKVDPITSVGRVAFSPDGKQALSCHPEGEVRIWSLDRFEKGKEVQVLKDHASPPVAVFAPDGRSVATGRRNDGGVWLWNSDGKPVRRLTTAGYLHDLRFLPGGEQLVLSSSITNDHNIHIHETATGKEILPPAGHLAGVTAVGLSLEGRTLASAGNEVFLRLWDLDSGARSEMPRQRAAVSCGSVSGIGFHPDGKRLCFWGPSHLNLPLVDLNTARYVTPTYNRQPGGPIVSAAITRDGRYAVTGGSGNDGSVRMWSLADGKEIRKIDVARNQGEARITLAPDMRRVLRSGPGKTWLIHLRCGQTLHDWPEAQWTPFLPDGQAVFFGGASDPIWQITGDKPEQHGEFKVNLSGSHTRALSADGKRVAAVFPVPATQQSHVVVQELSSARVIWEWTAPEHFGQVRAVALSPDGGHLLAGNDDGTVYVIRLP